MAVVELFLVFLKLGILGFGGPPAHLELMRQECVEQRQWLTQEELLDLIGAANLVPGPNSTEVALHIGYRRAGIAGMLLVGVGFIIPAVLITAALAWAYVRFGQLPWARAFAAGLRPGVVAIILVSAYRLGRPALKSPWIAACAVAAFVASMQGVPEAIVLIVAGALAAIRLRPSQSLQVSALPLFLYFLQIGATIYGGGYVLASYLQTGLVDQMHWMTPAQVADSVAIGQVTPGPVFSTATFVGYALGGPAGAAAATVGIFLPSFLLVPLMGRAATWARSHHWFGRFLDGVTAASVALMLAVAIKLVPTSVSKPVDIALGLAVLGLCLATRLNPGLLVVGAGLLRLITG